MRYLSRVTKQDFALWCHLRGKILLICLTPLALAACAAPQVLVVASEADLQRGLTMAQVETVLGKPYNSSGSSSDIGRLDLRHYVSAKTKRAYSITYWNGRVERIQWKDISAEIAEIEERANAKLAYGQTKEQVRQIIGAPIQVTGSEFDTHWWYYVSDEAIYILNFKDNIYVNHVKTSLAALQQYFQMPQTKNY